jgi:8-oxo-dGTP pyrophosphatase MutT (NUDIX family)
LLLIAVANVGLIANNRRFFDEKTDMDTKHHNEGPQTTSNPWQTLSINQVYDNPWIRVTHREVRNPSGGAGIYGVVHFKNVAIGIVPIDAEGYTWLVGQYRYALDRYSWEIPEGGGPLNRPLLESAQRELLEETGIRAQRWTPLLDMHLSNSVSDEYGIVYVAQELEFGAAQPEETEQLQIRRLPFSEALEMVLQGEITDSLSVAALLKVNEWLRRGILNV